MTLQLLLFSLPTKGTIERISFPTLPMSTFGFLIDSVEILKLHGAYQCNSEKNEILTQKNFFLTKLKV